MRRVPDVTAAAGLPTEADAAHGLSEAEFCVFYEQTARPLRAWLRRVAGVDQVDDVAQEAYLRLLRTPARELPPEERRAYLYRVAANLVNDTWRAQKRQGGVPVEIGKARLEAKAERPGDHLDMTRALARLRLRERTMLWLAYVERASHREIAAALDLKEGSVRVMLSRARQKAAAMLGVGPGGAR